MEEEEVGHMRLTGHKEYVACSRCGQPIDARAATLVPGDATETKSEYEHLCSTCQLALANGERDLPVM